MRQYLVPVVVALFLLVLGVDPALAQERATMSAPIIRAAGDDVTFTVRFEHLAAGRQYRIGVGFKAEKAPSIQVELRNGENAVKADPDTFSQGNTSGWWGVDEIAAKGFSLGSSSLPAAGESLQFITVISRDILDQQDKIYLFVSRDYGSGRWYLEDGSEIDSSDW